MADPKQPQRPDPHQPQQPGGGNPGGGDKRERQNPREPQRREPGADPYEREHTPQR